MDSTEKKRLRAEAHSRNPVVLIGHAGLSEAVLAEIETALDSHELIKVRVRADRDERRSINDEIIAATGSELIQTIGQITVLYRKSPEKKPAPKKIIRKPKNKNPATFKAREPGQHKTRRRQGGKAD